MVNADERSHIDDWSPLRQGSHHSADLPLDVELAFRSVFGLLAAISILP